MRRTYIVFAQRTLVCDVGDDAFVLLGFYEAATNADARRAAAKDYEIELDEVTAVAASHWSRTRAEHPPRTPDRTPSENG